MDFDPPSWSVKAIWLAHFAMSGWAMMSGYIEVSTYLFSQIGVLGIGAWAVIDPSSIDALIMFMSSLVVSIATDVVVITIYEPRGYYKFERQYPTPGNSQINEFRFAVTMSILNLILKPASLYVLYKLYNQNGGGSGSNNSNGGVSGSNNSSGGSARNNSSGGSGSHNSGGNSNVNSTPQDYQQTGYQNMGGPRNVEANNDNTYVDLHDAPQRTPPELPARNAPSGNNQQQRYQ